MIDIEYDIDYLNYINRLSSDNNITNPLVGFVRGNMFNNLYSQYKNYKPIMIEQKSKKEELLNKLREYNLGIIDLNLYLDLKPNDKRVINLFNNYVDNLGELKNRYEDMYGQLSVDCNNGADKFTWIMKPWPWEGDM